MKQLGSSLMSGVLLAALSLPLITISTKGAEAVRAENVGGRICNIPFQPKGTWIGRFRGLRESRFNFYDSYTDFWRSRCFENRANCEAWGYRMLSAYPIGAPTYNCRQK